MWNQDQSAIDNANTYLKYILTRALVSNYELSVLDGDERSVENISFKYEKIKLEYYTIQKDGSSKLHDQFTYELLKGK